MIGRRRSSLRGRALAGLLALAVVAPPPLPAQGPGTGTPFKPEQLEQLAAPIALYPDPLLAQVLMASTYPLEVVLAARFVQANPSLKGEALDEALRAQSWDDSVKSLTRVPQVLSMLNDKLDWTQKLGDAFLAQRQDLMDAIQRLRARAQAQGTLVTTPQQVVTVEPGPPPIIAIEPAAPDVVYVPIYNPLYAYGPWPYPMYLPYYYYPPGWVVTGAFFTFGLGIVVGGGLWGFCDWREHRIEIHVDRYHRFTRAVNIERRWDELDRGRSVPPGRPRLDWEHSPEHRRGTDYRDERTRERFGRPAARDAAAREMFRGRVEPGLVAPGRSSREELAPRPQPAPRPSPARPALPGAAPPREPGAFQGLGRGPDVRSYSDRGRESRQGLRPGPSPGVRSAPPRSAPPRSAPGAGAHGGGTRGGGGRR
jgi:hypothetical protein